MSDRRYTELHTNPAATELAGIPVLTYQKFNDFLDRLMGEEGTHCVAYFAVPGPETYRFFCVMAADENHALVVFSHVLNRSEGLSLPSITTRHFQFHVFEREIHEETGINFEGHPWLKPVRYPVARAHPESIPANYPFFNIEGEALHEVGVGPIHAGIIEPGHFRFICNGEQVLHLEIQLGYQHRGIKWLFHEKMGQLQRVLLAEGIAGDTAVGHSLAFSGMMEVLGGIEPSESLSVERSIALELERIGVHIGDTAALCNDVAYQFGQVVNEALRTVVINTTQLWCGNRFGKGLVRPGGTNYPLTQELAAGMRKNLQDVGKRYMQMADRIFSLPSVLGRFEETGVVTPRQATLAGVVGMAARSSGMHRDIRWSHPFAAYGNTGFEPDVIGKGDVWARAMLRKKEIGRSMELINLLLAGYDYAQPPSRPDFRIRTRPSMLAVSLTEGWRGEICHAGITNDQGEISYFYARDPSMHNWLALALALRNQEISDFPLCNKSFNLSYCGNDL